MRQRILQLYEQGKRTQDIAAFSGFCVAAVRRVRQQFKARGTLKPQTHLCGRKTLLTRTRQVRLEKLVTAQPDATLAELRQGLESELGIEVSRSHLGRWLDRMQLRLKKIPPHCRARQRRRPRQAASLVGADKSDRPTPTSVSG